MLHCTLRFVARDVGFRWLGDLLGVLFGCRSMYTWLGGLGNGCFEKLWVSCLTAFVFRAWFVATVLDLSVQVIGGNIFSSYCGYVHVGEQREDGYLLM